MTRRSLRPIVACLGVAALCLVSVREGSAQRVPPIEKFDATARDTSGPAPQKAGQSEIGLERWSKEAAAEKLGPAAGGGGAALLEALKTVGRPNGVIFS